MLTPKYLRFKCLLYLPVWGTIQYLGTFFNYSLIFKNQFGQSNCKSISLQYFAHHCCLLALCDESFPCDRLNIYSFLFICSTHIYLWREYSAFRSFSVFLIFIPLGLTKRGLLFFLYVYLYLLHR